MNSFMINGLLSKPFFLCANIEINKLLDIHNQITNHIVMKDIIEIPNEWKNISDLFVAIGDEQRQRILLSFEQNERINISQIVASSKLSRSAVTHHLKLLHQCNALQSEKVGKEVYFWVNKQHITQSIENVLNYIKQEI
jgi:predicted transcriptional regulator